MCPCLCRGKQKCKRVDSQRCCRFSGDGFLGRRKKKGCKHAQKPPEEDRSCHASEAPSDASEYGSSIYCSDGLTERRASYWTPKAKESSCLSDARSDASEVSGLEASSIGERPRRAWEDYWAEELPGYGF